MQFDEHPIGNWQAPPAKKKGMPLWAWILIALGGLGVLSCIGCVGVLAWIGSNSPNTQVYAGAQIPPDFTQTMKNLGALQDGEIIDHFYSDGMFEITEGFYFVSDQRVVIYSEYMEPQLISLTFDEIASADLYRDTSFFIDSEIVLTRFDGSSVYFPVSSEVDGDVRFHEAIQRRLPTVQE